MLAAFHVFHAFLMTSAWPETASMNSQKEPPDYLTVGQVAQQWQVGTRTVRRWIAEGDLPAYRVGGLVRVDRKDLTRFVKRVKSA